MGDRTNIDVLTLEDFQKTLAARLDEVNRLVDASLGDLAATPEFGKFDHARYVALDYDALRTQFFDRVIQLKQAIEAAQAATQSIIENYRTTEARNAASAADMAARLGGIAVILTVDETEGSTDVRA